MSPDDLADELLTAVFDADPLAGSLYGFPGRDDLLPDFSVAAQTEQSRALASLAERAEQMSEHGLEETELQTLDFVRNLARGMADAAVVPMIEFTISDTFVAPVTSVLTMLPKLQLDTTERRNGYLARLRGIPGMLATAEQRHQEGAAAGRTAVARLVDAAIAQLDLLVEDPTLGAIVRPDLDDQGFAREVSAAGEEYVRPALASYRDALRSDVLPAARDDDHPGLCFLPGGDAMYGAMAGLHTSMSRSPDELHAMDREIVGQVRQELIETGARLFATTDMAQIFDRLSNDPALRYRDREEMLDHARRAVAAAAFPCPTSRARSYRSPRRRRPAWRPPTTCPERSTGRGRGRTS